MKNDQYSFHFFQIVFELHNFLSKGSVHWPTVSKYIDELIGALIAKNHICTLIAVFHIINCDSSLCISKFHNIGATGRKNQIIRSGNDK